MVEIMLLRFTTSLLLKSMLAVTENFMIPRCLVMLEYKTCANKCRLMILACNCLDLIHFLFKKSGTTAANFQIQYLVKHPGPMMPGR